MRIPDSLLPNVRGRNKPIGIGKLNPLDQRGAKHWDEFHRQIWTAREYEEWKSRIPSFGCRCKKDFAELEIARPPEFDENGLLKFAWKVGIHNDVNEKLNRERNAGKTIMSEDNALACWHGIAPKRSDRLLVTVATGNTYTRLLTLTRPGFEAYAAKCKADYIEVTNVTSDQWQMEKFRIGELAKQYEQTLFVDSDCVILPNCPDLFDLPGLRMHDDRLELMQRPSGIEWAQPEYDSVMASQGLLSKPLKRIWNSGVVQCTRETASVWDHPPNRLPDSHCSEQFWVQYQAEKLGVMPLDVRCNFQWWFQDFADRVAEAWIVHFANAPNRFETIKAFLA